MKTRTHAASVFVVAAICVGSTGGLANANPSTVSTVQTGSTQALSEMQPTADPQVAINQAKSRDLAGFNHRLQRIKTSAALVSVANGFPDPEQVLSWYAAVATAGQVETAVANTAGKHFETVAADDGSGGETVRLVSNASTGEMRTQAWPRCWKAWVAYAAWQSAVGMTCGALGAMSGGVAGVWCGGVFFALNTLPDFNAAC